MNLADFFVVWINKMTKGEKAFITQSYVEANSKLGYEHELAVYIQDLGGLAVNDSILVTGELPVVIKARIASYTGDGVSAEIYKNPSYSGGAEIPLYNATQINPVTPEFAVFSGATITDDGDIAFAPEYLIGNSSNQGQGGTGQVVGRERILSPNSVYMLRLRSLDSLAQDVAVFDSFYEGGLDLP